MKNQSNKERLARIVVGLAVLKAGKHCQSKLGYLGFVPLLTGLTGYCPLKSCVKGEKCAKKCQKTEQSAEKA